MLWLRAFVVVGLALSASPLSAFSPETCRMVSDDGEAVVFRLFQPKFEFTSPTEEYRHAVLGDAVEYKAVTASFPRRSRRFKVPEGVDLAALPPESALELTLPEGFVFEDVLPRPFDWTSFEFHRRSGIPPLGLNIAVVETDVTQGASLAVYRLSCAGMQKVSATEPIGTANRWLAPAGIADFNGDGRNDIAYVETPHLAGILKIVTLQDDTLVPIAEPMPGFSNHRIGEDFITSGVRQCPDAPPMLILPNRRRDQLMGVTVADGGIIAKALDFEPTPEGVQAAAKCGL